MFSQNRNQPISVEFRGCFHDTVGKSTHNDPLAPGHNDPSAPNHNDPLAPFDTDPQ
jgi:hypothetical protein